MPDSGPALPSPWLAEADLDYAAPLRGTHHCDVAVVGGGLTGLSTAIELAGAGASVVLLEAETSGFGASARNAGHLTPTIGKDVPTLRRLFAREKTGRLLAYSDAAIAHVEHLIEKHGIACDYEAVGNVAGAVDEKQHGAIDRAAAAARENGLPGEVLDADAIGARGLPRSLTRGFFDPRGGVLHPARYCRGLRRVALEAGATICDRSRVVDIDESSPAAVVRTEGGSLRADRVVLATNAYTPALGRLRSSGLRLQVQLFRTEPLGDVQLARIPWSGREGIYTAHEALESYRLTADNRIVGGSKFVRYGFNDRVLPDVDSSVAARLELVFRDRFPELDDVAVECHWGGSIFLSMDFLPRVGCADRHGRVLHSLAYAGHGVAHASFAGKVLADWLADRESPGSVLYERKGIPLPPEPLRWVVFQVLSKTLELVDRRVDRRAADRSSKRSERATAAAACSTRQQYRSRGSTAKRR